MDLAVSVVRERTSGAKSDRLLRDVSHVRRVFAELECQEQNRKLTSEEVRAFELNGNWALDWSVVCISKAVSKPLAVERVRGCFFHGPVVLGDLSGEICLQGTEHCPQPCGLYNSTLAWCIIGDGAFVKSCNMVCRCILRPGAALVGCGLISSSYASSGSCLDGGGGGGSGRSCRFGNGVAVEVGPETGGRTVTCYATMTLAEAASVAVDRASPEAVMEHQAAVEKFAEMASCEATVIGEGARVLSCPRVVDVYLGAHAFLESCEVEQATVLSTVDEPSRITSGSILRRTLVQEGVTVERGCIVGNSLLMEHSHVANQGQVIQSVLGPDSGVASGECLHSLVGPFVGFHHQSLLIAAIWPLGRGNLGYGANVGSNHTSRQADQEVWPGEGVFFGLSTVMKFPANYSESPFSVIAAGVTCLPQRVAFPFSLINSQEQGDLGDISPGFNHLRPGWVLAESMFMVIRNEDKYQRRVKARRNRVDWTIFRPSVMKLVAGARARLVAAASAKKDIYLGDRDIAGLGKNYMTEAARLTGVASYTLHLRRYALRGLLARLEAGLPADVNEKEIPADGEGVNGTGGRLSPPSRSPSDIAQLLTLSLGNQSSTETGALVAGDDETWGFQKSLLLAEYVEEDRGLNTLLEKLIAIEAEVAQGVESSKAKDDKRGAQVVPGYADAHTPAKEEAAVKLAYSVQAKVEEKAKTIMSRM